jgi:hypothetical protein
MYSVSDGLGMCLPPIYGIYLHAQLTADCAARSAFSTSIVSLIPDGHHGTYHTYRPVSSHHARNGALTTMSHKKQDNTRRASMMGGKTMMVCCKQWSENWTHLS